MVDIVQRTSLTYKYLFEELSDKRTKNWLLMASPEPVLTILTAYLYFCIYAGPKYMKDKRPYKLKYVMTLYNLFQIGISMFLTYNALEYVIQAGYRLSCIDVDYSTNPMAITWASNVWWYFFAKLTEMLETVFFVLRKKSNQVSFLHLYHHSVVFLLSWYCSKYTPGGQLIPEGGINSFIHVLMYTYYFLAALGPRYKKLLWWKKYLTSLQLIQFCIIVYSNLSGLFAKNCNYPKNLQIFVLLNCLVFICMFGFFYYQNYVKINTKNFEQKKS